LLGGIESFLIILGAFVFHFASLEVYLAGVAAGSLKEGLTRILGLMISLGWYIVSTEPVRLFTWLAVWAVGIVFIILAFLEQLGSYGRRNFPVLDYLYVLWIFLRLGWSYSGLESGGPKSRRMQKVCALVLAIALWGFLSIIASELLFERKSDEYMHGRVSFFPVITILAVFFRPRDGAGDYIRASELADDANCPEDLELTENADTDTNESLAGSTANAGYEDTPREDIPQLT